MPTYNNLPAPSDHFKGKWYRQLIEDLQLAGKARRTVYGYVRAVRKLADFCQQSPHMIDESDLRGFMSPNNKLQWEDVRWLIWRSLGWTYWLASGRFQPPPPQPKPPKCDHCGGELELIGMTHPDHRLVWSKSLTQRGPPCD